ncbi:MAG TPA: aminoglycoside 6-adenylyltransferase [Opitutaceae bacterium]|jgi:hypothetical protein
MSGAPDGWPAAVAAWAEGRPDIRALVQIGSRVQEGAQPDAWSDYDYHLITTEPARYRDGSFASELGPCWASGSQTAFGNSTKVTAVYGGALEADFIVVTNWEIRIALAALLLPALEPLWPPPLRAGVASLRIVAAPGWRIIKGGADWARRYRRIHALSAPMAHGEYLRLGGEFWTQLVWAAKKAQRGEFRASQRALHLHLIEAALRMMQEEASLEGRASGPLSRRAEEWLSPDRAAATAFASSPDRAALMAGLRRLAEAFSASSASVAKARGWPNPDRAEVRGWLASLPG